MTKIDSSISSKFLKLQMDGITVLINKSHVVTVRFKGTSNTELKMSNGEIINLVTGDNLISHLEQNANTH
ncbi:MAG TPA: hypothetical protein VMI35_00350 [Puia sp.]|nr:hypothetical protein [Puia sp.]